MFVKVPLMVIVLAPSDTGTVKLPLNLSLAKAVTFKLEVALFEKEDEFLSIVKP